jgi:DNA-binding NarL/FixJ family response regulator
MNALPRLTPREREIVELLHCGYSYRLIAARLHISRETVKVHVRHIAAKLPYEASADPPAPALRRILANAAALLAA